MNQHPVNDEVLFLYCKNYVGVNLRWSMALTTEIARLQAFQQRNMESTTWLRPRLEWKLIPSVAVLTAAITLATLRHKTLPMAVLSPCLSPWPTAHYWGCRLMQSRQPVLLVLWARAVLADTGVEQCESPVDFQKNTYVWCLELFFIF